MDNNSSTSDQALNTTNPSQKKTKKNKIVNTFDKKSEKHGTNKENSKKRVHNEISDTNNSDIGKDTDNGNDADNEDESATCELFSVTGINDLVKKYMGQINFSDEAKRQVYNEMITKACCIEQAARLIANVRSNKIYEFDEKGNLLTFNQEPLRTDVNGDVVPVPPEEWNELRIDLVSTLNIETIVLSYLVHRIFSGAMLQRSDQQIYLDAISTCSSIKNSEAVKSRSSRITKKTKKE